MGTQTKFQTRGTRLSQQAGQHHLLSLKVVMPVKRSNKKYLFLGMYIFFLYREVEISLQIERFF